MARRLIKQRTLAAIAVAFAGGFSVVGCGGDDNPPPAADSGTDAAPVRDSGSDARDTGTGGSTPGTDGAAGTTTDGGQPDTGIPDTGLPDTAPGDTGTGGSQGDTDSGTGGAGGNGGEGTGGTMLEGGTGGTTTTPDGGTGGTVLPDAGPDSPIGTEDGGDGSVDGSPGTPTAQLSTEPIAFGSVDCGSNTTTKTLPIKNTGTAALTVKASFAGNAFSVAPAEASIAAGATETFTITAAVPTTATAASALTDSLTIATNETGTNSRNITVSATPRGGTLVWNDGLPADAVMNFGIAPLNVADTPLTLTLKNTGNAEVSVTPAAVEAPFGISPAGAATNVAANGTLQLTASFTPTSENKVSTNSKLTVTGPVCTGGTGSVSQVNLAGQGGKSAVSGWVETVDFGLNPCGGAAPGTKTFVLQNSGNVDAHLASVAVTGTTGYGVNITKDSVIPAGGSLTVAVTAPAVPAESAVPTTYPVTSAGPGVYLGTLTVVTSDVEEDNKTHTVTLVEGARGAIIQYESTGFGAFGPGPIGATRQAPFKVINSGNEGAQVTLLPEAPFAVTIPTFTVAAGATQNDTLGFVAPSSGAVSKTLPMQVVGTLCAPKPADVTLSGVGQDGLLVPTTRMDDFKVTCQADQAAADLVAQNLTISNLGITSLSWTATLDDSGLFDIAPASGTLPSYQSSSVIKVTPRRFDYSPLDLTQRLTIKSQTVTSAGGTREDEFAVDLAVAPKGDVVAANVTEVDLGTVPVTLAGQQADQVFRIINQANMNSDPATIQLALGGANPDKFTLLEPGPTEDATPLALPIQLAPGATRDVRVRFSPGTTVPQPGDPGDASARSATITMSYGTDPQCAAPQTNIDLKGLGSAALVQIPTQGLDFGQLNCNYDTANDAPTTVTLSNLANQDYHIVATLSQGSQYFILDSGNNTVPAAQGANPGTLGVTVKPASIPRYVTAQEINAGFTGELTITTDAAGDVDNQTPPQAVQHKIGLFVRPKGVIISEDEPLTLFTWDFGAVRSGFYRELFIGITNTGNANALAVLTPANSVIGQYFSMLDPRVPANQSFLLRALFQPLTGTSATFTTQANLKIVPVPGEVFCQPLPSSWGGPELAPGSPDSPGATVTLVGYSEPGPI